MELEANSRLPKHITFCTNLFGGAGIGSFRRVKNLRKYTNLDARLYALCGPGHYLESGFVEYLLDDEEWQIFWREYVDTSHTPLTKLPGYKAQEFFANWLSTDESRWNHILNNADILHLHWNNALFNFENSSLFTFDKPIVWTFADMYWFTGGCHYSEGCEGYKTDCSNCPLLGGSKQIAKLNWEKKYNFFRALKNVSIICPSEWLATKAKESSILKDFDIHVINNPNDEDLTPYNSKVAKIQLNTGLDKYLMLVGAAAHSNKRKGMDILVKALKILEREDNLLESLKIITYGNGNIDSKFEVQNLGSFNNTQEQQLIFSAADFYCFTSRAENSPLVVQESLQFGTPVIGFDVGNVSDVLSDDISGYSVRNIDPETLANAIRNYFQTQILKTTSIERTISASRRANNFYNSYNSIRQHVDLYSSKQKNNDIALLDFASTDWKEIAKKSTSKSRITSSGKRSHLVPKYDRISTHRESTKSDSSAGRNKNSITSDMSQSSVSSSHCSQNLRVEQLIIDLNSPNINAILNIKSSDASNLGGSGEHCLSDSFLHFVSDMILNEDISLSIDVQLVIPILVHLKESLSNKVQNLSLYVFEINKENKENSLGLNSEANNTESSTSLGKLIKASLCKSNSPNDDKNIQWIVYNTNVQAIINDSLNLINNFGIQNLIVPNFNRANTIERKFISLLTESYKVESYNVNNYIQLSRKQQVNSSTLSLSINSNIVFPLFNNHHQLDKFLNSLSNTLKDLEFIKYKINIVMSDASPDLQLSKSLYHSNTDERFTFICNRLPTTAFWSESIAKGLIYCEQIFCDFLIIANVDVVLNKDAMLNMIEALNLRSNTKALITCCATSQKSNLPVTVGAHFDPDTPNVFEPVDSRIFLNKNHKLSNLVVKNNTYNSATISACFGYFTGLSFTTDQLSNEILPNYQKLPHYWGDTEWSLRLFKKFDFLIEVISNCNVEVDDSDESTGDHRNILDAKKLLFSLRSNDSLVYLTSAFDLLKDYFPSTDSFVNYCKMLIDRKFQKVKS